VGGFAHEFALARTVRDAAALLDAVNGPSPGDRYYVARPPTRYVDALADPPPALRVAVHTDAYFGLPTEPGVRAAVENTAAALERMGHHVQTDRPAIAEEALRDCLETVWAVDLAGLAATFAHVTRREAGPGQVEAASWACIRRGREIGALELEAAASAVNSTARAWGRFLEEHDLFLCPTATSPAPPSGVPDQDDARIATASQWLDAMAERTPFTPIANVTGQPALSLPLGETDDGMPLGVMLTAQTLREDLLLRVAATLEQAMPWIGRRPAVDAGERK
jgi:amidase